MQGTGGVADVGGEEEGGALLGEVPESGDVSLRDPQRHCLREAWGGRRGAVSFSG